MITIKSFLASALLFNAAVVSADTVVEFKNNNVMSQLLTNGQMARINTRGTDEFMIVNLKTRNVYSITPKNREIFNISDSVPSISLLDPPKVRVDIKPAGKGPVIAGYTTNKFRLSANGEHCGTVFASRDALKGSAVEDIVDTLKTMVDSHLDSLGGFAAIFPSCQIARLRLADKLRHIGAPMRLVDTEGRVETEVTKIIKTAQVEPHNYVLPENYKPVSALEKIEQLLSGNPQTEKKEKSRSDKERAAGELQRGDRLPPYAMERTRYYQDRMRPPR